MLHVYTQRQSLKTAGRLNQRQFQQIIGARNLLRYARTTLLMLLIFAGKKATTQTSGCITGFSDPRANPAGAGGISVVSADFDNDGKLDLAKVNSSRNSVSIMAGDGAGNFGTPATNTVGSGAVQIAVGDFNRDGLPDLVVANYTDNNNFRSAEPWQLRVCYAGYVRRR